MCCNYLAKLSKFSRVTHELLTFENHPAYAGITCKGFVDLSRTRDHPRLRGNYILSAYAFPSSVGSPPLTRELRTTITTDKHCRRITPAYAGTTYKQAWWGYKAWDHPRLRGNYSCFFIYVLADSGSYPLTRELLHKFYKWFCHLGITTAYAGTTPSIVQWFCHNRDHPRLRGNYYAFSFMLRCSPGSPPLTRELPVLFDVSLCRFGITPAHAGTTTMTQKRYSYLWDHPRLRGNYLTSLITFSAVPGSPPLTRELLDWEFKVAIWLRITPAYAGITIAIWCSRI